MTKLKLLFLALALGWSGLARTELAAKPRYWVLNLDALYARPFQGHNVNFDTTQGLGGQALFEWTALGNRSVLFGAHSQGLMTGSSTAQYSGLDVGMRFFGLNGYAEPYFLFLAGWDLLNTAEDPAQLRAASFVAQGGLGLRMPLGDSWAWTLGADYHYRPASPALQWVQARLGLQVRLGFRPTPYPTPIPQVDLRATPTPVPLKVPASVGGVAPGFALYGLKAGQTWWSIAKETLGDGRLYPLLMDLNPEANQNGLTPGQDLRVPTRPTPKAKAQALKDYQADQVREAARLVRSTGSSSKTSLSNPPKAKKPTH